MPVLEVACPHCGQETNATIAPGCQLSGIQKEYQTFDADQFGHSENTCQYCGSEFHVYFQT